MTNERDWLDVKAEDDPLERYRRLVDGSGIGLFQTGRDGRVLWVNRTAAAIVGYDSAEEFLAKVKDIHEIYVEPSKRDEFERLIEEHGSVEEFEYEIRRKDGSIRWISVTSRPMPLDHEELGFEGVVIDVTERHLLHAALAAVSAEREPRAAMERFAAVLQRIVPFRQLTLAVIEGESYRRLVSVSTSRSADFSRGEKVPLAGNSMEEVVNQSKAVVVNDTLEGRYPFDRILHSRGVSSYAILPLTDDEGRVFATFNVGAADADAFDRSVVELLLGVASAIAAAMRNIILFERERA